jgi:hypothetical protein
MGFSSPYDTDLVEMVSSPTFALEVVRHGHISSRLSIPELLMAIDRTSVRTTANRTTMSTTLSSNKTSITVSVLQLLQYTIQFVSFWRHSLSLVPEEESGIEVSPYFISSFTHIFPSNFLIKNF